MNEALSALEREFAALFVKRALHSQPLNQEPRTRAKGPINQDKLEHRYRQLLDTTSRVVGQARRFSGEIAQGMKRSANALKQLVLEGLRQELDEMTSRVRQVMNYSPIGRPSIPPEKLLRAMLLQALYSIRSALRGDGTEADLKISPHRRIGGTDL